VAQDRPPPFRALFGVRSSRGVNGQETRTWGLAPVAADIIERVTAYGRYGYRGSTVAKSFPMKLDVGGSISVSARLSRVARSCGVSLYISKGYGMCARVQALPLARV